MKNTNLKHLNLLSTQYKSASEASSEIIRLAALLNLPKGTEHFLTDIHGEDESFSHVLRNASGVIKGYIEEIFGNNLMSIEKRNLATLAYYPQQKLEYIKEKMITQESNQNINEWYRVQLLRLIKLCKRVGSKHTRDTVRKVLPKNLAYILDELLYENPISSISSDNHKSNYYNNIIDNIIRLNQSDNFIIAIAEVIQRLSIDHLHIIGDVYDRGNGAAKVMDMLMNYHSVDIQWGNHDIIWMGAASGCVGCVTNVIRIQARYNNLNTIEEDYGINLIPLATFAMEYYANDPCTQFLPKVPCKSEKENQLIAKMHKAITVIQLKVEAEIIKRHPEYEMNNRSLLNKIDYKKGTVNIDGTMYNLLDNYFPTIDQKNPCALHEDEKEILEKILMSFKNSQKLSSHIRFLYNKGSLYTIYNKNLLFHGCIPMDKNGEFKKVKIFCEPLSGKEWLSKLDDMSRKAYFLKDTSDEKQTALDTMWYMWCGSSSPLFGKDIMRTFERYFLSDKATHSEIKDPYYKLQDEEETAIKILKEFGIAENSFSKIINGHVPVQVSKGENPIKANGKLLVIDGGFAKAYQKVTGIAGYTLIYNSRGLVLTAHSATFNNAKDTIENETDMVTETFYIEKTPQKLNVKDTDKGQTIKEKISDLEELLNAYERGIIKES